MHLKIVKFGSPRSYRKGDVNTCMNSYISISDKAKLTVSKLWKSVGEVTKKKGNYKA